MGDKVVLEKDPAASDFRSHNAPCLRALPKLLCVHVQEDGSFGKVEGSQLVVSEVDRFDPIVERPRATRHGRFCAS